MSAGTDVKPPIEAFALWLATGEKGISSKAIVEHLTGVPVGEYHWGPRDHPHDPSDFRRCELLLRAVPIARTFFPQMRSRSDVWARLVDAWDELVALAEEEVPGAFDGADGAAPRMYARMRELIEPSTTDVATADA